MVEFMALVGVKCTIKEVPVDTCKVVLSIRPCFHVLSADERN